MKKRTVLFIFIAFILGGACGGGGLVIADHYMSGGSTESLIAYVKSEIVPQAVQMLGYIMALYIGTKPIINKVVTGADGFIKSSAIVSEVKNVGDKTSAEVSALVSESREAIKVYRAAAESAMCEVAAMRADFKSIKDALRVGFANNGELVRNGYARRICEILEENDGEKEI